jgi:hypothetical protein
MQSEEPKNSGFATLMGKGSGLFTEEGTAQVTAAFAKAVADAVAANELLDLQEPSRDREWESPK